MSLLDLPEPSSTEVSFLRRRSASAPSLESFTLALKTVTPILGGGVIARSPELPSVDIIRVPTLRGHLRFWWRALYGHDFVARGSAGAEELSLRERQLWGGMGRAGKVLNEDAKRAHRSQVEIRVLDVRPAGEDTGKIGLGTPPAYALWPARNKGKQDDIPRWSPGLRFTLEVIAPPGEPMAQVRNALRAWILFGGYGSRSRRGCGSMDLESRDPKLRAQWLPSESSRESLQRVLGGLPLFTTSPQGPPCDMATLQGAYLYRASANARVSNGSDAWTYALGWLRDFRQGTERWGEMRPARNPSEKGRDGRSNWPEADKIRRFARPSLRDVRGMASGKAYPEEHAPRPEHSASPAWPRAGFGLPIVFHFQPENRDEQPYSPQEPAGCVLQWARKIKNRWEPMDRLASPLIVKALPLANGQFTPIALWLERGTPANGHVVMMQNKRVVARSEVSFEKSFRASDDTPLFKPLQCADNLRDAFFQWLKETRKAQEA
ncbi:type III-B CRISPR module RAMP protein Cmr1 [Comamonas sp. JC664]|uniref:type III-B CRISPR module RAMP protein Cmr1 n=1 Tax=Comamonas sp. JC664 TaxID=2801917 RepID=UPI00174AFD28|nr:type III-B CRISPR module RAMP protein Cmr1 [Comamonas sp. JC664]MBL0695019.1 type III-B CRISPR module RAMP protein Cmr1 [Comamonas sp. JC664]GHH02673.1 type III-B CRISPR module RAMP protein Cmr1 [Comamonas sp. KCTC 72670]